MLQLKKKKRRIRRLSLYHEFYNHFNKINHEHHNQIEGENNSDSNDVTFGGHIGEISGFAALGDGSKEIKELIETPYLIMKEELSTAHSINGIQGVLFFQTSRSQSLEIDNAEIGVLKWNIDYGFYFDLKLRLLDNGRKRQATSYCLALQEDYGLIMLDISKNPKIENQKIHIFNKPYKKDNYNIPVNDRGEFLIWGGSDLSDISSGIYELDVATLNADPNPLTTGWGNDPSCKCCWNAYNQSWSCGYLCGSHSKPGNSGTVALPGQAAYFPLKWGSLVNNACPCNRASPHQSRCGTSWVPNSKYGCIKCVCDARCASEVTCSTNLQDDYTCPKRDIYYVSDCNQCNKGVNWCDQNRWVPFGQYTLNDTGVTLAQWGCGNVTVGTQSTQDPSTGKVYVLDEPDLPNQIPSNI